MEEGHIATPVSRSTLWAVLGGGTVAAGILLATIALPAEYGIDPLGTGKRLGLLGLANAAAQPAVPAAIAGATILPVLQPKKQVSRWGESAVVTGAFIAQPVSFKVDSREIVLDPGEGVEIKYHLARGAGLVYSWTATQAVLFDFHAEPDTKPAGEQNGEYFESYDREDISGKTASNGTLIAPSSGIHGWYWENAGPGPVTLHLVAGGFYDWIFQNRNEHKTRLRPTDAYSLPSHPAIPDQSL